MKRLIKKSNSILVENIKKSIEKKIGSNIRWQTPFIYSEVSEPDGNVVNTIICWKEKDINTDYEYTFYVTTNGDEVVNCEMDNIDVLK